MPDVFNLSVIKPLVKDPKKPSDDWQRLKKCHNWQRLRKCHN
jgi:hypothetical protein